MDNSEHRPRHDPQPFLDTPRRTHDRAPASPAHSARALSADSDGDASAYTLMAAGRRTGKTAFLRLLLDTSPVSPTATQDQLAGVAKFVQGCAGYTSHIRTVSVNVDLAVGVPASDKTELRTLTLSLVDTPSLDFDDPAASQRTVDEIMRHVDTRFSESVQDVSASDNRLASPPDHFPRPTKRTRAITMYICESSLSIPGLLGCCVLDTHTDALHTMPCRAEAFSRVVAFSPAE